MHLLVWYFMALTVLKLLNLYSISHLGSLESRESVPEHHTAYYSVGYYGATANYHIFFKGQLNEHGLKLLNIKKGLIILTLSHFKSF